MLVRKEESMFRKSLEPSYSLFHMGSRYWSQSDSLWMVGLHHQVTSIRMTHNGGNGFNCDELGASSSAVETFDAGTGSSLTSQQLWAQTRSAILTFLRHKQAEVQLKVGPHLTESYTKSALLTLHFLFYFSLELLWNSNTLPGSSILKVLKQLGLKSPTQTPLPGRLVKLYILQANSL